MNCKQLHEYCEMNPRADINLDLASAELAEHLAECPACNCLIEEQKQLAKYLRDVRDSVPAISASLDNEVLARYRSYQSEQWRAPLTATLIERINLRDAMGLALALAFAGLVAYGAMLLFLPGQRSWVDPRSRTLHHVTVPRTAAIANDGAAMTREPARARLRSVVASAKHRNSSAAVIQDSSVRTKFQSLMYCDYISCPGTMDVIRVQLPSPMLGITSGPVQTKGSISADVLVGPDGIARGIRFVE